MTATNLVIGVLVLGLVIYRQLIVRPVRDNFRVPLIIGIIGVVELYSFLKDHHHENGTIAAGLVGSLVLAAVFGAVRAMTTKVWIRDGRAWQQGNWLTAVLWVIGLGAHLSYDALVYKSSALGNVTILVYLAVTLAVQRVILQTRADRLPMEAGAGPGPAAGNGRTGF
jgi:hypothetical protein